MPKPTSPVDLDRLAALMARREKFEKQKASLNEALRKTAGRTGPMLD